jgi:hypothetical protein
MRLWLCNVECDFSLGSARFAQLVGALNVAKCILCTHDGPKFALFDERRQFIQRAYVRSNEQKREFELPSSSLPLAWHYYSVSGDTRTDSAQTSGPSV